MRTSGMLLAAFGAFVIGVTPALAAIPTSEQQAALRADCASDFEANCSGITADSLAALDCLEKNVEKLSAACQAAVKAVDPEAGK
jgi:hypothetical protein